MAFSLTTHTAIQCSSLKPIPNGVITYALDNTPNYGLGTVATYACDTGFVLDVSLGGSEMRTCVDDNGLDAEGVFDRQAPRCVRKLGGSPIIYRVVIIKWISHPISIFTAMECPPLPTITNGMISYSPDVTPDYDLGTNATYTCEAGFYLEGNQVQMCVDADGMDAIGVWSGQEPSCVRK